MNASVSLVPARTSHARPEINTRQVEVTDLSNVRLYRLRQVLERIPVSRSAWFAGIQVGRYPKGLSLGPRTRVWRSDAIDEIIQSISGLEAI
jgi:predicted DNA-binding transcriptional regulator AlpA